MWYDKYITTEYCTHVAENATTTIIFFFAFFETVFRHGRHRGAAAVATAAVAVAPTRRAVGGGVSSCGNAVVGDVTTSMRIYAGVRAVRGGEPLIRCCVSSSKNPFRPQCGPRAAHTKLFRTAAPRRLLRRFPFVFLPLAQIRPRTHARVIRSDCTLTLARNYTGAWKRTL